MNYRLTLAYDGTNYHGWQVQKNAVSVQSVFQEAVYTICNDFPPVKGCSRTDTGVHANMYSVSFKTEKKLAPERLLKALNQRLPKDIAVTSCELADDNFHARYSAKSKRYVYKILNRPVRSPFLEGYALHYRYPLDEKLLHEASQAYIGRHDFAAFQSGNGGKTDTVRNVFSFEVRREGDMIYMTVEADGFLYNMVRIMAGTLLRIAEGKIPADGIPRIIESGDRSNAGHTAPAHGLYLDFVTY